MNINQSTSALAKMTDSVAEGLYQKLAKILNPATIVYIPNAFIHVHQIALRDWKFPKLLTLLKLNPT